MKKISLIGSTGSIGTQTLDVVEANPDRYRVVALAARRSWQLLAEQARKFEPAVVATLDEEAAAQLEGALADTDIKVLAGMDGVVQAAAWAGTDLTVSSLVGMAGLLPTLAALEAGISVALANKEALVVGGDLVTRAAQANGCHLLPIDSEHSAIFQCLQGEQRAQVSRLILTASGGPFRTFARARLTQVKASDALKHPTWDMGAKITIDSASLMNKGFEVLEAKHLFGLPLDMVDVWVHPQSIVHSLVEFIDGSVIAQLGPPDMRTPIQYALSYPERIAPIWSRLELPAMANLSFEAPRWDDFPCLRLAFEAGRQGGSMPAVLNAANEVAVAAFLEDQITFLDIPRILQATCAAHTLIAEPTVDNLLEVDAWARAFAAKVGAAPINV
ncbi:MAG: 1-deoxy-D-xylulose-5-phosphate reductoisomerase [Vulcanimicrobiota bacterium]